MELFLKAVAGVLVAVILILALDHLKKEFSVLLVIAVCCMIAGIASTFFAPILDLLRELNGIGQLQEDFLGILLKAAGVALVSEMTGMICTDAGNSSLGKTIQMLGNAVILYLSIPLFRNLLTLIQEILGEI